MGLICFYLGIGAGYAGSELRRRRREQFALMLTVSVSELGVLFVLDALLWPLWIYLYPPK